ncbi:hypothetical protein Q7P35_002918 [Cladosporium inversicolor]
MNTDIDESDCIVIQKGGGEVGKRSVEVAGSKDPAVADASALSLEAGERAEEGRGGQKERSSTDAARKDERAISIDTRRTKAEKADFALVKERLQNGLDKAKDNSVEGHDFTAMKVHWLSKANVTKKVGSLVIWLKNKLVADYLLRNGTAIFSATGAYCSKWERREDNLLCFNCNRAAVWVNQRCQASSVPVESYDIAAVLIKLRERNLVVMACYKARNGESEAEREEDLAERLRAIDTATKRAQEKIGDELLDVILCTDFNRHHVLWGGHRAQRTAYRQNEGDQIVDYVQTAKLQSLLPARTITWEH